MGEISSGGIDQEPSRELAENEQNLTRIAEMYQANGIVISGIDQRAEQNNLLVIEAIQAAGAEIDKNGRYNEIFGIGLGGSRVKGYNKISSDIDLAFISPLASKGNGEKLAAIELTREQLNQRHIGNGIDVFLEAMGASRDVPVEADDFVNWVDHHTDEVVTLFGYCPYSNPNMELVRLAALEVIMSNTDPEELEDRWTTVQLDYDEFYLGEPDHTNGKIAERLQLDRQKVNEIMNTQLYKKRRGKFSLKDPREMYDNLSAWYRQNEDNLDKYVMNKVYLGVKDLLESGY